MLYSIANGERNVVRGCSYESEDPVARCQEAIGGNVDDASMLSCLVCNGDLCNSAAKSYIALLPLFIGLLVNL